jgi:hypothetical protein
MKNEEIVVAPDNWTEKPGTLFSFRVWEGRLWRKEVSACFFGGYQIKYIPLFGRGLRIAAEWLS